MSIVPCLKTIKISSTLMSGAFEVISYILYADIGMVRPSTDALSFLHWATSFIPSSANSHYGGNHLLFHIIQQLPSAFSLAMLSFCLNILRKYQQSYYGPAFST